MSLFFGLYLHFLTYPPGKYSVKEKMLEQQPTVGIWSIHLDLQDSLRRKLMKVGFKL